jgi:hypothetical protein
VQVSEDELQAIIVELARHGGARSIATTRAELAARLDEAGIPVPSTSWLDAVAREAMHGRVYVLDAEHSPVEETDDPALSEALSEAPAELPIPRAIAQQPQASTTPEAGSEPRVSRSRFAALSRGEVAALVVVGAAVVLAVAQRLRSRGRGDASAVEESTRSRHRR